MNKFVSLALLLLLMWACSGPAKKDVEKHESLSVPKHQRHIIYKDSFSKSEKGFIDEWMHQCLSATSETLGNYPFDLKILIHRMNANEPVPWAHTIRTKQHEQVNFYVNPQRTLNEFINDWTAPHELSHLAIPFLGRSNAWFAEGFATYMQVQVMEKMGLHNSEETDSLYKAKLLKYLPFYNSTRTFITCSDSLVKKHNYPAMYWGSVSYFYRLNDSLELNNNSSLCALVKQYQHSNRLSDHNIDDLIMSWDSLCGSSYPSELFNEYFTGEARQMVHSVLKKF